MPYDLSQLRAFLCVVEAGTIGRAARELHMSQPALSRAIKRLEDTVGEHLFERHTTGMRLTTFGAALVPHARVLNYEEEAAREKINAMRGLATGALRVGTTSSTSALMLPKILSSFSQRWPAIRIDAIEGVRDQLTVALTNYDVDLILAADAADSADVVSLKECRWTENISVVVGASHPLRHECKGLTLEQIRSERWGMVPEGTEPHERLTQLFTAQGMEPPKMMVSTTSIQLLKSMVVHANLVSWLTTPMYEAERLAQQIYPLDVPGLSETRSFTVFRRRNGVLPSPASRLVDEIQT